MRIRLSLVRFLLEATFLVQRLPAVEDLYAEGRVIRHQSSRPGRIGANIVSLHYVPIGSGSGDSHSGEAKHTKRTIDVA